MKLVLVGGFLGSGKTTAIVRACQYLMRQNKKVAVITNDQGNQQVDTAYVNSFGIPTREVADGCFCCNYNQLDEHLQSLRENQPDIIFAESVGSCTDLVATIAKPLSQLKPDVEIIISIFADASYLCSLIENRSSFLEESVRYIYKKQLEEADLLIINKTDLIDLNQLAVVDRVIQSDYPGKIIIRQNSLSENDISNWLNLIDRYTTNSERNSLDLNYDLYGEGESKLAWLDKSITIQTTHQDAVRVAHRIIGLIFDRIQEHRVTIGHLKFFLEADQWKEKISFTTASTSADMKRANHPAHAVSMLINARVQSEPTWLKRVVDEVLIYAERTFDCSIKTEKWSVFKPGYPRPTHRIV